MKRYYNIIMLVLIVILVSLVVISVNMLNKTKFSNYSSPVNMKVKRYPNTEKQTPKTIRNKNIVKEKITAENVIYNKALVLDAFKHIAFGSDFKVTKEEEEGLNKIKKWTNPVIVAVVGDNLEENRELVRKHVENLNNAIPLEVRMYNPKTDWNKSTILVFFEKDFREAIYKKYRRDFENMYTRYMGDKDYLKKDYEKIIAPGVPLHYFSVLIGKKSNILFSIVFIRSNSGQEEIWSGIQEEITQTLGLAKDYKNYPFTLFNDSYSTKNLMPLDWLLLKILYHEKVEPGMTIKEFEKIYDDVYNEVIGGK